MNMHKPYTNTIQLENVSHSNFKMSSCCFICLTQQIKQQPEQWEQEHKAGTKLSNCHPFRPKTIAPL